MLTRLWFLAAADPTKQLDELDARARSTFRLDATDTFLVMGAALVLVGLVFFWAFFLRKRPDRKNGVPTLDAYSAHGAKRRRRSSSHRDSGTGARSPSTASGGAARQPEASASAKDGLPSARRSLRRRSSQRSSSGRAADPPPVDPGKRVRVRKRRRHRSEEYPRNPTLGETGGLPPLRPEDPEPAGPESNEKTPE